MELLSIDGSYGEGGGEILRTATALAAVLEKSCHIFNIRASRPRPGLALQHLLGLQALSQLSDGKLEGANLGSKEIKFYPHAKNFGVGVYSQEISPKEIKVEIETAGSITLILQTLLIPSLFAPAPFKIQFKGGATDTFFSPPIDYFRFVFLPNLEKLINSLPKAKGGKVNINILRRGFYPKGGAEVEVEIFPLEFSQKITKFSFKDRGELKRILVISGASEFLKKRKVAQRQITGAKQTPLFYHKAKLPIETKIEYYDTLSPGSQMTIIGEFENTVLGASALGRLLKSSEEVGKEAAMEFLKETRKPVALDSHFSDQILPYIALFTKSAKLTTSEITQHTKTNIWVIEKFIRGNFQVKDNVITWKTK
ncbi:MAG: RNA 3'-phosphate cyclase [Parcubacteria group bacterium CG_4_9_14_0_2_um_filter_35_11]|nr:MAG: RNA 3'-phosphate cyclase [Parcubacteria group bacterium CG07_land_8_20_14_0_80_35_11]PJC47677.1 MAG: RNA 3'-phosphate cyclase [Parcubacteria group bacterium CG_4_9_14_0_2_um_filter_35_11]